MKDANNVEFVTTKVPPDGGYGWVVASAMALNSFIYIPLSSCFGLIFKDTFAELGLSAAEVSLIVNLHTAFGMLTGLLNGVLLKLFGYRKTAMLAAVLYFGGITSTSFARSFPFFIVAYGLVACSSPRFLCGSNGDDDDNCSSGLGDVQVVLQLGLEHLLQEEEEQGDRFHGHRNGFRAHRPATTDYFFDEVLRPPRSYAHLRRPLCALFCDGVAVATSQVAHEG
jgi:hypothetical protein